MKETTRDYIAVLSDRCIDPTQLLLPFTHSCSLQLLSRVCRESCAANRLDKCATCYVCGNCNQFKLHYNRLFCIRFL